MSSVSKQLLNATATPLASIFGSGFLVIIPILNGVAGPYSVFAMAAVCGLAYAVGAVIRHNIRRAEPLLESGGAPRAASIELVSDFALVLAYVISVCLYLRILSSFLLTAINLDSEYNERVVTTGIVALIGAVALTKGLQALEKLEQWALWATLVIIAAVIAAFGVYDVRQLGGPGIEWPAVPHDSLWPALTVLGGTLITVQGFETSRYLGEEYNADLRIRSCRLSQIISTVIYVAFVALATPLLPVLGGKVEDNGLMVITAAAAAWLVTPLVVAAVFSQFSAAVADTLGGEGNAVEASRGRIDPKLAYVFICGGAIALCWTADTLQILAIASRAFAFYYMLQCLVGIAVSSDPLRRAGMGAVAAILAFITVFAVPAG